MLICMRTTIILPDELYDQVRLAAAQDRRTITSLIEEALRRVLAERAAAGEAPRFEATVIPGRGVQPGVDLDDNAALADLMDAS